MNILEVCAETGEPAWTSSVLDKCWSRQLFSPRCSNLPLPQQNYSGSSV